MALRKLKQSIRGASNPWGAINDLLANIVETLNAISGSALTLERGVTPTASQAIASVSYVVAAGASNVCILTGTIKDAAGATIAGIRKLDVYISELVTGVGVTADTYSTGASITTGTVVVADTANKAWQLITDANGVFAISITATAKPADQYLVAVNPVSGALMVSAASGTAWGA